ncbi:hypothetical protein ACWEK5_18265 [Rhodococcus koreensis]
MGRSVLALLAAEREPDRVVRATTLVEALLWLHAVPDAETPAFLDPPPE